jgi:hypothetical protein
LKRKRILGILGILGFWDWKRHFNARSGTRSTGADGRHADGPRTGNFLLRTVAAGKVAVGGCLELVQLCYLRWQEYPASRSDDGLSRGDGPPGDIPVCGSVCVLVPGCRARLCERAIYCLSLHSPSALSSVSRLPPPASRPPSSVIRSLTFFSQKPIYVSDMIFQVRDFGPTREVHKAAGFW